MEKLRIHSSAYGARIKRKRRIIVIICIFAALILGVLFYFLKSSTPLTGSGSRELSSAEVYKYWKENRYEEIYSSTASVLKNSPVDAFSLVFYGFSSFYLGIAKIDNEERVSYLDSSICALRKALILRNTPLGAEVHYILGKAYFHKGHYFLDEAIDELETAQRLGYSGKDSFEYLALAYYQLDRYPKSIDYFRKALGNNTSDILLVAAAQAFEKAGQDKDAEDFLRKAIDTTKDVTIEEKARFLLGSIFLKNKAFAEAERQFAFVIEKDPNSAEAHYRLGLLYQETGDSVRARAEWRKAVKIDPTHAAARQHLN